MLRIAFILLFIASNSLAANIRNENRCVAENADNNNESPVLMGAIHNLCEKWQDKYEKLSWRMLSIDNKSFLESEKANPVYETGDLRNGRVWVRITNKVNASQTTAMVWFRVKGYLPVWTAKHDVAANSTLHEADVVQSLGDVTTANLLDEHIIKQPEGMYVRKALRKGQMISTDNVSEPPLVAQNQNVQILVQNNSLQITAKAVALSSGWHVGDTVTVMVNGASEKTEAVVTKRGWVYVSN